MTSKAHVKSLKPLVGTIAGPASVVLSVLLLVIKESPFYIDLSAVALVGLLLSWRFKIKGAAASSLLLSAVFAYDYFIEIDPIGIWDFGLAASIGLSYFITALASQETIEAIQKAGNTALDEIASWEKKFTDLLHSNKTLEADLFISKDRFLQINDQLKAKIESAERAERLLKIARDELLSQTSLREKTEVQYHELKRELALIKEDLSIERLNCKAIQQGSEKLIESLQSMSKAAEEKLHDLLGQLEGMTEKIKTLQSEKEDLEKALDEALKPTEIELQAPERGRYFGLYNQLRTQFEEKKEELQKARKENFDLQQQLLELQKEQEENSTQDVHELTASYKRIADALLEKEREVEELETIVAKLLNRS